MLTKVALAASFVCGLSAHAQTDVTSTYLKNAGFDDGCKESGEFKTSTTYEITDWTGSSNFAQSVGVSIKVGSSATFNGASVPATNSEGKAEGGVACYSMGWNSQQVVYTQKVTLPAGMYKLSYTAYNCNTSGNSYGSNRVGFVSDAGKTYYGSKTSFTSGKWETDDVYFTLEEETSGSISVGFAAKNESSDKNAKVCIDYVKLYTVFDVEWNALTAKANSWLTNCASCTGTERTDLESAIKTAPTTYAEYQAAYPAALAKLEAFSAKAISDIKTSYTNDLTSVLGSDITKWTESNYRTNNADQYWNGDAKHDYYESDDWNNASWTRKATQTVTLPAGKYAFVAAGRGSTGSTLTMSVGDVSLAMANKGDTGYGIDTEGNATFSSTATYTNSGKGRGWEWTAIPFELTEGKDVTFRFDASASAKYNWVSIYDVQLLSTNVAKDIAVGYSALAAALATANAIGTKANVGDGAFQIPQSAATTFATAINEAQKVLGNSESTAEQLSKSKETLAEATTTYQATELNKPAEGAKFNITPRDNANYQPDGKALTLTSNTSTTGGYGMGYTQAAGHYSAQAFTFTPVSDATNQYTLSTEVEGKTLYVCTGTVYNGSDSQLRVTTDADKALKVKVETTTTDGRYNLRNMATNTLISGNGEKDAGFFTADKQWNKFALTEATKNTATLAVTSAKWATFVAPFEAAIPDGVKAYTCAGVDEGDNTLLKLTAESGTLKANTPYILYAESEVNAELSGYATAAQASYGSGMLTGVYAQSPVANTVANTDGTTTTNYVLQNQDGKVAFYPVKTDNVTSAANRVYLTAKQAANSEAKCFSLSFEDGNTTAIRTAAHVEAAAEAARYNAAGARISKPTRGLNIVKLSDGRTVKQIVR